MIWGYTWKLDKAEYDDYQRSESSPMPKNYLKYISTVDGCTDALSSQQKDQLHILSRPFSVFWYAKKGYLHECSQFRRFWITYFKF